jgi:dienelactone hydrolase
MDRRFAHAISLVLAVLAVLVPTLATAQEEFRPPSGKGRLVVVLSGHTGPGYYRRVSAQIAELGYDVVLFDSNKIIASAQQRDYGAAMSATIAQARQMPGALPGKIGLVGFSLGGGLALGPGSKLADDVAVVAAWYPMTSEFKDVAGFASRIRVPVLMFAGTADEYKSCCLITKANEIAAAAKAANAPFELTTYAGVKHGFVVSDPNYNPGAVNDAFARTAAALKFHLRN